MRKLGFLIALIGVGLCVAPLVDSLQEWVYWLENWGPKQAWMIRGGTIILGLIVVLIAPLPEE